VTGRACYNPAVKTRLLFGVIAAAVFSTVVSAHFVLIQPAASMIQNRLGDPQKIGPCGGVSANPARGTPANPGVPSGAITNVKGGTDLPLFVSESIFHPGHYRVALARTMAQLPKDPEVTVVQTEQGPRSKSAVIQNPPAPPILLDGIFAHTERPTEHADLRDHDSDPEHQLPDLRAAGDRVHGRAPGVAPSTAATRITTARR
jgi:hypothetical protein